MGSRDDMRVPDPLIPPALAVVVLGLLASLGWGVGDFGGGLRAGARRSSACSRGSQLASLFVGVPICALGERAGHAAEDVADLGRSAASFGATGLALLYRGLADGPDGRRRAVAAVLTATLPVAFGFLTEGVPSVVAIGGIGFAAVSVVLVSRSPDAGDGRPERARLRPRRRARSSGCSRSRRRSCPTT